MKRVIANWGLHPKKVMRALGIRCKLGPFDFQPLRDYPFGELGYDEEEGLKFETDTDRIGNIVSWIRDFYAKHQIPFLFDDDDSAFFTCKLTSPTRGKIGPEDYKFEAAGLQRKEGYDFVWELRR